MTSLPRSTQPPRTLGPVPDLERHLPADWWRTLFNAVYLRTDGDVVENDANTKLEVDTLVRAAGLEANDRILDLCCGQGRHSIELAVRGFCNVTGLDRSRYLIRLARRRAKNASLSIRFREGDARKFAVREGGFDCALLMGNSFGYFEQEEDDLAVLTAVKRALRARGTVAIDLTDGDWIRANFEPRSWEWIDQNHLVCRERSLSGDGDRLISREVIVHAEKGILVDQFYAERLYSAERISDLLSRAAFRNIRVHNSLEALSTRGTDLGMMARRLLVTAHAPAERLPKKAGVPFPDVTVLLGDPRLPDAVKKNGQFNPEDFETVEKLKNALAALGAYRFNFLDNHDTLFADLRGCKPDFVLNLCDEGFDNDALKELHVPAVLEILGTPYSGAAPGALATCYNKSIVRAVAAACDIPVPLESYDEADDQSATIPSVFPAIIKPCLGDSSIGITKDAVVHDPAEAVAYLADLRRAWPDRPLLVQEFLPGAEYSVGLIGNPGFGLTPLPILEVDYSDLDSGLPKILGYESKWLPTSPYWQQIKFKEAQVHENVRRNLIDWSIALFERLACRDYARFDFRTDRSGKVKLLEANPNPGWCWDGKLNLMAGFAGLRYPDLLEMILEVAQRRVAIGTDTAIEIVSNRNAVA